MHGMMFLSMTLCNGGVKLIIAWPYMVQFYGTIFRWVIAKDKGPSEHVLPHPVASTYGQAWVRWSKGIQDQDKFDCRDSKEFSRNAPRFPSMSAPEDIEEAQKRHAYKKIKVMEHWHIIASVVGWIGIPLRHWFIKPWSLTQVRVSSMRFWASSALSAHGLWKGLMSIVKRLLRFWRLLEVFFLFGNLAKKTQAFQKTATQVFMTCQRAMTTRTARWNVARTNLDRTQ